MIDLSALLIADTGQTARTITLVSKDNFDSWLSGQTPRARASVSAAQFGAKAAEMLIIPGDMADDWQVALGVADLADLTPWCLAPAAERLPEGLYRLAKASTPAAALGWLLAQHKFTRYKKADRHVGARVLLTPHVAHIADTVAQAEATAWVRDLVSTPANDMGPAALEAEAASLAAAHSATLTVTKGDALINDYPLIHAVGRAAHADHAPRLIELEWGNQKHPRVAIIGKGVCFDTGGLNLKTGSYMRLMKKDMGGAAHALALAGLVMRARLKVRLHLLIPAVENALGGHAFRPGDVLKSRAGLSVEIDNTDAEGRLVLADALTKAGEASPALILDFATLTGAARVALGPDLPALFTNDDVLAADLMVAARAQSDPLWRLPLYSGYTEMLKSDIADLVNAADGGMAGAITAALFLERFVVDDTSWAHFDTYAWHGAAKPGRPKGGEALGLRAAFALLKTRFSG